MKNDDALNGMGEIAKFCGKSRPTIHRWIKELGFPVLHRGNGRAVFTTKFAIAMWILSMSHRELYYPKGGLPKL